MSLLPLLLISPISRSSGKITVASTLQLSLFPSPATPLRYTEAFLFYMFSYMLPNMEEGENLSKSSSSSVFLCRRKISLHFCSGKRKIMLLQVEVLAVPEHSYILQITGLAWMWVISWWISPRPFLNTVRALILYALMSSSFPSGAPWTICPAAVSSLIRSHSVLISCAYLPSQPVEPNL